jgi:ribulose-5-phosphate 4-epimerase/fuculose-1-phosphate aldolase
MQQSMQQGQTSLLMVGIQPGRARERNPYGVNIEHTREQVARIGRFLFDRRLTDAAGGNISARVGDLLCMSPSYSGSQRQWQLEPDHVLVVDLNGNIAAELRGKEDKIRKQAAGVIAPWHGLFLMGKDLDAAFDAVERFDTNAYIILMAEAAGLGSKLAEKSAKLLELTALGKGH